MPGQVVGVRFVGYTQSKRRFPAFADGLPAGGGFSVAGSGLASSGGGTTISIANGGVTLGMLAAGAALSVLGVTGNAVAQRADIVAAVDGDILRRVGNTVVFGSVFLAGSAAAPSVAIGDPSNGLYFLGAAGATEAIGFTTFGVVRGNWSATGLRVGAATAASDLFHVYSTTLAVDILRCSDSLGVVGIGMAPLTSIKLGITQPSGTQLRCYYDASNFIGLSVGSTGLCAMMGGGTSSALRIQLAGQSNVGVVSQLQVLSTTAMAAGVGGIISLHGNNTGAGGSTAFAAIRGSKANATEAETGGDLLFYARANGVNLAVGATLFGATNIFALAGALGVGNSAAATTPGTVTRKMEVFSAAGVSLGFVPIYDAIT